MNPFPKNTAKLDEQAQQQAQLMEFLKSNPEVMKKYQEELTKMQGMSKNKVLQQPMTSKQYQSNVKNGTIESFLDQEGGLVIKPDTGIVIKLFDKNSGQKIFVNVVKHQGVDHPEQKVLVDLENQSGLRIPMSMGKVRQDNDKKGTPCKVVDVVMNPKIVQSAETTPDIFYFMAQIISNYLLEKYKIIVAEDKIMKVNMKYKGTNVEIQRIKAKKSPKIEEMQKKEKKSQQQQEEQERILSGISSNATKFTNKPEFKVFGINSSGQREQYSLQDKGQIKALQIQIDLSLLIHSRGIHLEATDRIIYLFVKGLYDICLRIPEAIQSYSAKFGKKERVLKLVCQVLNEREQKVKEQSAKAVKKIDIEIKSSLLDQLV